MGILTTLWVSTIGLLILTIGIFMFSYDNEPVVVKNVSSVRFYRYVCYDGYKYLEFDSYPRYGLAQVMEEGPFGVRPARCENKHVEERSWM